MNTIEVKDVCLTLSKTEILKHINVSFEKGKIHGLIGRNGSGKTMLMKCICGFIKPDSGKIFVQDKQVGKDVDFPQNMGIIIETPGFIPYYSGYKNLKLLAGLNNKIGREEIRKSMECRLTENSFCLKTLMNLISVSMIMWQMLLIR